jgi:hypothetical protein
VAESAVVDVEEVCAASSPRVGWGPRVLPRRGYVCRAAWRLVAGFRRVDFYCYCSF